MLKNDNKIQTFLHLRFFSQSVLFNFRNTNIYSHKDDFSTHQQTTRSSACWGSARRRCFPRSILQDYVSSERCWRRKRSNVHENWMRASRRERKKSLAQTSPVDLFGRELCEEIRASSTGGNIRRSVAITQIFTEYIDDSRTARCLSLSPNRDGMLIISKMLYGYWRTNEPVGLVHSIPHLLS